MASLEFFVGAVLGIALISRIPIWALKAWKGRSITRLLLAHLLTYVIAAIGSAYGAANGGPIQWESGFRGYALPTLLIFMLDAIGIFRAIHIKRKELSSRADEPIWYIHVNGQERGPVPTTVIRDSLARGTLRFDDWIWHDGLPNWVQISSVGQFAAERKSLVITKGRGANYLLRHWRGELSLPVSYWLSSFAMALPFIAIYIVISQVELSNYPRLISAVVICVWPAIVIAQIWLSVGIWRSADQYSRMRPTRYWGGIAKLVTALGCISTLSSFVTQGLPQIGGFTEIISQANQARYSIRLLRENTELEIVGPLDFGLAQAVGESLKLNPSITTIHLNSPGGRLAEADKLSSFILQKNLNTYVSTTCLSACVTVFASGRERLLSRAAVLGLHEPYFPGFEAADLEAMSVQTRNFLISRGISPEFVTRGLSAPHSSIWKPSHNEMFQSRLATSYATDANVAVSGIQVQDLTEVEKVLDRIDLYKVLRVQYPKEHASIMQIFAAGFEKGRSIADLRVETWAIILPLVNKSLPSASDEALLAFYQVATDEIEALSRISSESCEAYLKGDPKGFNFNSFPKDLQQRDISATAELIRTHGNYKGERITEQQLEGVFLTIVAAAQSAGFNQDEFHKGTQFQLSAVQNCKVMLVFFRSILALGPIDRNLALRYMAQQSSAQ